MNFIKKLVEGKPDEGIHIQFQKFSKGEFRNRAVMKASKTAGKYNINTTYEFAGDMMEIMAKKLGDKKTMVEGVIVSTSDLTGQINFTGKKQFMGVKQYLIKSEMSGKEILDICEKFPRAFIGLSFKVGDDELKIKQKAPKSAKPSTKEDQRPNPDFCKLKTTDINVVKDFIFEVPEFKKAEITHHFMITDLVIPKNEKDFAKMREMAKRKGKIVRDALIDEKSYKKEIDFEV